MAKCLRMALVQMLGSADKAANVAKAVDLISKAAAGGAELVVLPECFNSPYGTQFFDSYAEAIPGDTTAALCAAAAASSVDVIGGSIPERRGGRLYNTAPLINRSGSLVGQFSKIHLFDIDVPGGIRFQESEVLSPGDQPLIFRTPKVDIGIGICYDVRFANLAQMYAESGCRLLVFPSAFNMTTGPAHWDTLARARALDNQVYMAFCSPARDDAASYVAYGHSLCYDPWGDKIAAADEKETIIYADIDLDKLEKIRHMVPITQQRRDDIYELNVNIKPTVVE